LPVIVSLSRWLVRVVGMFTAVWFVVVVMRPCGPPGRVVAGGAGNAADLSHL
jgi:hypothetical protein